jgi:hypothetical protein
MPITTTIGLVPLLNEAEAARLLNLSIRTLQAWRSRGFGPPYVRVGRAIRYIEKSLRDFVEANTVWSNTGSFRADSVSADRSLGRGVPAARARS